MNAAYVLALFSLKQLFAAILKPNNAAIIKSFPLLIYKDGQDKTAWSLEKLKFMKMALVGWLCFIFMNGAAQMLLGLKGKILEALGLFATAIAICCVIKG